MSINTNNNDYVLVIGASHLDIVGDYGKHLANDIDKPGELIYSVGGTAYNISSNLSQNDIPVRFVTALKEDSLITPVILRRLESYDIDTSKIKSIIVIPSSELLTIPFEALQTSRGEFLIELYDIHYNYSIELMNGIAASTKEEKFLGFASSYGSFDSKYDTLLNNYSLDKIPFAVDEVSNISKLLKSKTYLNQEASIPNFLNSYQKFGIIHLALHSHLNNEYPDQSALIFESDSTDLMLNAERIYNLEIDASLVVLSACNTAVGEINEGDGVRSLTRSFIHAGSESVLTSLWDTPDHSTKIIMEDFYAGLQRGLNKDTALRKAKLNYLASATPTMKHPRHWAHLILVGDTSPIKFAKKFDSKLLILTSVIVFAIGLLIYSICKLLD